MKQIAQRNVIRFWQFVNHINPPGRHQVSLQTR